ncbi:hypothetical protein J31TS4_41750 [Paenibacillus sp. J31TS4]|uniref:DUF4385 domain-containing protein n=1 Tax=Paenibacillus sp. J31TS4 TaxID=2807195 RepID=UPI001B1897F8|nr:DUF4385 domain-containing protein [Paenibacillus sp. J31TS4]GIP40895.1 hypothetical protein J31TS4_41750 [Paenibacillus sp. J31TS4]
MDFNYSLDYKTLDFRENPHLYRIGRGEQGVLMVEPYKSELLPHWRFRTPELASDSSEMIYGMFLAYLEEDDFVGADMARKFLQMGYSRARRYANHRTGRKYSKRSGDVLPYDFDPEKARAAAIFREKWELAKENKEYKAMKKRHRALHEVEESHA